MTNLTHCPSCNIDLVKKCLRCGHEWVSKVREPMKCANNVTCGSRYWDKPRKGDLDAVDWGDE